MKNPRCVIWEAVSSLKQAEKISRHEQRELNLQHMARHGGILIADLDVPGHTRDYALLEEARADMEAYEQLFQLIRSQAFDVLICLNRGRLGRTLALIETIAELCRRANILIYETQSPLPSLDVSTNSYVDLVTGAFRSASAQHEIEELRRRQEMGMLGRFKRGDFLQGVPWGWKVHYDEQTGKPTIVVDEAAAYVIRLAMVTLYCEQGMGTHYIARELNQRGFRTVTGLPWHVKNVNNLFRMVWRYAGYGEINAFSRKKKRPYARAKGNWPPILSEEELHRILENRNARRGKRGVGIAATYRFSLMVYCEHCNRRMLTTYQTRAYGRREIYATCENTTHKHRNILIRNVIKPVREFMESLQDESVWSQYLAEDDTGTAEIDAKINAVTDEIRKAEQAILRADDKLIDGTFDDLRHSHQVRRLREQIERLRQDLTTLHDRRKAIDHASHKLDRLREIAERGIAYLEMEDERAANALLRPLFRVWVKDRKVHRIEIL